MRLKTFFTPLFSCRFFASILGPFWCPFGCPKRLFLPPVGRQVPLFVFELQFLVFQLLFFTLGLLPECKMCVFPWVFLLSSLTRILFLSCSCGRFWRFKLHVLEPPNAPKSTPKALRKRFSILLRSRSQICLVLGPAWAPQNRSKIPCRPLGGHLAALKLHLGGLSSCLGAHRGILMTVLVVLGPFGRPWGTISAPFWSLLGPF